MSHNIKGPYLEYYFEEISSLLIRYYEWHTAENGKKQPYFISLPTVTDTKQRILKQEVKGEGVDEDIKKEVTSDGKDQSIKEEIKPNIKEEPGDGEVKIDIKQDFKTEVKAENKEEVQKDMKAESDSHFDEGLFHSHIEVWNGATTSTDPLILAMRYQ